jgi:acyl-homoserine lactone acylase PvdQ
MRRAVAFSLLAGLLSPGVARAQAPPIGVPAVGTFRSVLAQGEGQQLNALEFGAYQVSGNPPATFTSQQPLYVGVMPQASTLIPADLDRFYKRTDFGMLPGGVGSETSPRPGVRILRDARFGMAHIYGDTRADVMFGAGYATAEERLFAMDALRHAAKGTLAALTGPDGAEMDRQQLTDQNFTDDELRAQFEALPNKFGPLGARGRQDVLDYIDGINARIDEVRSDPSKLPAEYPALGVTPQRWDVSDTVAMAVLLVTQFTVSNGGEERNAQMRLEFRKRFGKKWKRRFADFRNRDDAETFTVARARHRSDRPGRSRRRRAVNLMPDLGSITQFNPQTAGTGAAEARSTAAWVRTVNRLKRELPDEESNAVLVAPGLSKSGKPLWAAGPQVDYWSPQIFSEYELHGGGLDVTGVTFPGASPWPLIGHGVDFAWSGTSANGDNNDTFVETLCNVDGSPATSKSRAYMYRGKCTPFFERDVRVTTPPPSAGNQNPSQEIVYHPLRSVHGPVFAFATVKGKPVALTKAKAVDFRELDAVLPFMAMAENQPTDFASFKQAFSPFPGTENWFYVDDRSVGFLQSGYYPAHARGADVDLPYNGDGTGDWRGFDPDRYTYDFIPLSRRPQAESTKQPIIVSWNQKEAPGWRKGPTEWTDGSVHRAELLYHRLRDRIADGDRKTDLVGLTRAVNEAATEDLRGAEVYPWMRKVIARGAPDDERWLGLLDAWHADGSHRLDLNGDNVYEHSAAVALFDEWWPLFVRAAFEPGLGGELFGKVESGFLSLGTTTADGWGWGWSSHVEKDLRMVLGRRVRGPHSRRYCGGANKRRARAACRTILLETLHQAVGNARVRFATDDPAAWRVPATCAQASPPLCDQNVPTALGAVETPPFPWQNRGTYHQVVEMAGRR